MPRRQEKSKTRTGTDLHGRSVDGRDLYALCQLRNVSTGHTAQELFMVNGLVNMHGHKLRRPLGVFRAQFLSDFNRDDPFNCIISTQKYISVSVLI